MLGAGCLGFQGTRRPARRAGDYSRFDGDGSEGRVSCDVAAGLPATSYAARLGSTGLLIRVDGATLLMSRGEGPADLAFAAGHGIHRLISGDLLVDRAISTGAIEVLRGSGELLDRFATTFHLAA